MNRKRAIGAEIVDGGVHFRVWAPAHESVAVVIDGDATPLDREDDGYFSKLIPTVGRRYRFRLADGDYPDPASRYQPDGPHGDSVVVDSSTFRWQHPPPRIDRRIISEIHIGTFTNEGTFAAAIEKLPLLADVGINTIEVMPVNEFAGRFGWGYDGVDLWAPFHGYGAPDDFRRFIDAAHALGLAVILDVVYNHFGPDGCYLAKFTPSYFTKKHPTEWGEAINYEEPPVCEFFVENAAYWIDEFRLDGLRLDATQSIHRRDLIGDITERARGVTDRELFIVAENEPQEVRLINELGVDALWNDDWHHSARVALGGKREAYYTDYCGRVQEFVSMARLGFLYQGQWYSWQKHWRGTPSHDLDPRRFVCFLENHDQVANSATGARLHQLAPENKLRALTALLFLAPQTPMLFQGQEFASSKPFFYFADHDPELAKLVAAGRREFLRQFPSIDTFTPPHDEQTFNACKLDWSEREANAEVLAFHRDLIRLRASMPETRPEGALLNDEAFVLRWFGERVTPSDRLLIVNLGGALELAPASEPLLAPPPDCEWQVEWSCGSAELFTPRDRRRSSSGGDVSDRRDRDRAT